MRSLLHRDDLTFLIRLLQLGDLGVVPRAEQFNECVLIGAKTLKQGVITGSRGVNKWGQHTQSSHRVTRSQQTWVMQESHGSQLKEGSDSGSYNTVCHQVSAGFTSVTGCHLISLGVTEYQQVSLCVNAWHLMSPCVTRCHMV